MAKISRKIQKILGINSAADDIGIFGSKKDGTPATSKDVATIQGLSTYWEDGVVPILGATYNDIMVQDWQAIMYVLSYQVAYLFQEGIPEWETNTTYSLNSIVKSGSVLYLSLTDPNVGNAVTSASNWQPIIDLSRMKWNTTNKTLDLLDGSGNTTIRLDANNGTIKMIGDVETGGTF